MEIVIKISDEIYKKYMDDRTHVTDVLHAVRHGTLLPKGHGRLIDADAMQKYQIDTFGQRLLVIDTAPTIIEADGGGEDES